MGGLRHFRDGLFLTAITAVLRRVVAGVENVVGNLVPHLRFPVVQPFNRSELDFFLESSIGLAPCIQFWFFGFLA